MGYRVGMGYHCRTMSVGPKMYGLYGGMGYGGMDYKRVDCIMPPIYLLSLAWCILFHTTGVPLVFPYTALVHPWSPLQYLCSTD